MFKNSVFSMSPKRKGKSQKTYIGASHYQKNFEYKLQKKWRIQQMQEESTTISAVKAGQKSEET